MEFGAGFWLNAEADHNKVEACKSIPNKIKDPKKIYFHPIHKLNSTPFPFNYFDDENHIGHPEYEVLGMLAKRNSTKEVGDTLNITDPVERHPQYLL